MRKVAVGLLLFTWLTCAQCHTYYLGSCPTVEPMTGFDMDKVILKFNKKKTLIIPSY